MIRKKPALGLDPGDELPRFSEKIMLHPKI
jgi:hypothetical protein